MNLSLSGFSFSSCPFLQEWLHSHFYREVSDY